MKKYTDKKENLIGQKNKTIKEIVKDKFFKALMIELELKNKI